ncbi:MAG: isochorismatase [Chloroflexota bacterium]
MIRITSPYKKRPIRYLGLAQHNGWRIKLYGIRYHEDGAGEFPDAVQVELGKEKVLGELPETAVTDQQYGVGFLIIHQGQQRTWYLLDWWWGEDILKQKLFSAPLDNPAHITPAEPDLMACVWELAVHSFERQAWINTVLNNPDGASLGAYLAQQMNEDV